jgi:hypothetical protein
MSLHAVRNPSLIKAWMLFLKFSDAANPEPNILAFGRQTGSLVHSFILRRFHRITRREPRAKPELLYPGTEDLKLTRPTGSGKLRETY